jgi:conjugal transfer pilus assembly protein TraD
MYFENLWRPAYEYYSAISWFIAAIVTYVVGGLYYPAINLHTWVSLGIAVVGLTRAGDAYKLIRWQVYLRSYKVLVKDPQWLIKKVENDPNHYYLGRGFKWGAEHAQRAHQVLGMSSDMSELSIPYPFSVMSKKIAKDSKEAPGEPWIHGVGTEEDIFQHINSLAGHTMIFGTTGSGKTRLMEAVTLQAIHRGDTVIAIDPKGDRDWENRLKKELKRLGREKDFYKFSPAHESESVRINPLKNYTRVGELATRITELMEGGKDSGPFVAFSWKVLNQIIGGMVAAGERPTLYRIKQYLQGDKAVLLEKIMNYHMTEKIGHEWKDKYDDRIREAGKKNKALGIMAVYGELTKSGQLETNEALEGVWTLITHNQDNMMAMTASLLPIMEKLTAGPLRKLFSITQEDISDPRPEIDMMKIVRSGKVLYVALDSISDSTVATAIGGILLADVVSVAGARYNYGSGGDRQVSIYVDEAAEVVNRPFIQLLNKGRGAKFSCTFASQTMPDFVAKLGSEAEARKILGNANNLIALRLSDKDTIEFCSESFGKTTIKTTMQTTNTTAGTGTEMANWSGGYGERLIPTEADVFSGTLIAKLPNLQFVLRSADGSLIKGRLPTFNDTGWKS